MSSTSESPRNLSDRIFRDSLQHQANLRAFLREAVPDLADGFDYERARPLLREFPVDDWRHREADLPFEIPYRCGDEEVLALVLLLIEHQSDTDPVLPLRLLYFAVMYWDRQWREWEQRKPPRPPLRLHPVLPLVLYTGAMPWGSSQTLVELLDEPAALHVYAPVWQPLFWNLSECTAEALLSSGEAWLQMLAVLRAQGEGPEGFAAVFTEAVQRLSSLHGSDHVRWYDLMRILLTWAGSRRPQVERARLLEVAVRSQGQAGPRGEVVTMTQTIAEAWIAEGEARGRVEGELRATRKLLRQLLEDRFGPLPEALVQRIEASTELERLEAAVRQAPRVPGLEQLSL
jgi:hypothetical protein